HFCPVHRTFLADQRYTYPQADDRVPLTAACRSGWSSPVLTRPLSRLRPAQLAGVPRSALPAAARIPPPVGPVRLARDLDSGGARSRAIPAHLCPAIPRRSSAGDGAGTILPVEGSKGGFPPTAWRLRRCIVRPSDHRPFRSRRRRRQSHH